MSVVRAFFMCLSMFSAIPCPYRPWDEEARGLMTACLPLVGAVVGALWFALSALGRMWLPDTLSAAWIAALPLLLTGFMHLDGLMDTADALLSWRPLEDRQKILKDVHCGSFSVAAAILLILGMYAAAADCRTADLRALALIPVASRCMSAFCVTALKPIGHSEYAALRRNTATPLAALIMLALTLLAGGLWLGGAGLIALIATIAGYGLAMAWAVHALRGVSGDLAGCALCRSLRGAYALREPVDFATSGMLRAEETFRLIFGDIPHEIIRDLREAEMGEFEMHSYEELKDNPHYQAWLADATGAFVIPGGESNAGVMRRVSECIARLVHRERDLFVVCHGGVIGCAMTSSFPDSGRSFYDWIPQACHGFAIDFRDGRPEAWSAI